MTLVAALLVPIVGTEAAAAPPPGTPFTWGVNGYGQLGSGAVSSTPRGPAAVSGLTDVVDLHGGREHVAAMTSSGQVYVWGSNQEGQLGLGGGGNRLTPTAVPSLSDAVAVETGHNFTVVLRSDGTVWTFGLNSTGQLGDGTRTIRRSPVKVAGLSGVVSIAAGRDMGYALRADGTAWAWGSNANGELGDGTRTDRSTPVRIGSLTDVVGIAGGRNHGLALRADGSVWAFGSNAYGQLGDGTRTDRLTPVQVATGISEVTAGAHHSYALRTDGRVLSWGRNYRAELGDGTTTARLRPVLVQGVDSAVSIGSGRDHGVAVLQDGTVRTWGYNLSGQLGDGTTTNRTSAVTVPGVQNASKAGGGGSTYSVVLVSNGPSPPQAPVARFSATCDRLDCRFDGTGSTDADGSVREYAWSFGDGSEATGAVVDHPFAAAGTYPVTLTVTDDSGLAASSTAPVTVSDAPPPASAFRAVATFNGNVTRPTVTLPAGVQAGDQLVLFVTTNRLATATTPTGWTARGTVVDGSDLKSWVFTRTAAAGTASATVPLDSISKTNLTLVAYSGAQAPSAVQAVNETGTSSVHRSPAAAVATSGSTVVTYWADKPPSSHGWSLPAEVTFRAGGAGTGGGLLTSVVGDSANVPAGTWPGATADAGTASAKALAWTVVLPPG